MDLFCLQSILLLILASLCFFNFFSSTAANGKGHGGGFKNYPVVSVLPEFIKNRNRFLDWSTEALASTPTNTAVFSRPWGSCGIITANPSNVEHMLKTRFNNYPKGEQFITLLHDFLGEGIFNSDGKLWRIQRKTASPEFSGKLLRNFVTENVAVELQTRLIPTLEKAHDLGRVLDLQDILKRFAFDSVCRLAFDFDPDCLSGDGDGSSEFMLAFGEAAELSSQRFMYLFTFMYRLKKLLNVGSEQQLRNAIATVHRFAEDIIRQRMQETMKKSNQEGLLSRFLGIENASAEFLRDIIVSFILAGRDTTSAALTWFFWLLSVNRSAEERILEELQDLRERNQKLPGDAYTFDELREMHYLHAAISEAMRLYPPVASDSRECLEDDVFPDGTLVKRGWIVTYNTYSMGRMEGVWGKDCLEFRPERWLETDGAGKAVFRQESPYKFPVFHAGPRICLGKDMAYIQMKSIAASVLERFAFDVQNRDVHPEILLSITMRMKGGLPVKVKLRSMDLCG